MTSNGLALTISSQAQREFKAAGGHYRDVLRHWRQEADFRSAYYGGRVEVFAKAGENVRLYDINSAYAFAMLRQFPVGNLSITEQYHKGCLGIYFIDWIKPVNLSYGILPCHNLNGALVFTYPEGRGWYCSPEIDLAYELGYKIRVVRGYYWKRSRQIFGEVVRQWYKAKSQSSGAIYEYYKRMLNSLSGRLGIRENSQDIIDRLPTKEEVKKYEVMPLDDNGHFFAINRHHHFNDVYVQLVAFITSYARVQLAKLVIDSEALYCDTDCVITRQELPIGDGIGELKIESYGDYIGLAPKLMMISRNTNEPEHIVHLSAKGFDKSQVTLEMFKEASRGNFDSFMTKITSLLGLKLCMVKGASFLTTVEVVRQLQSSDNKNNIPPEWMREEVKYQKWLERRYRVRYRYGVVERGVDYPEYDLAERLEKQDLLRHRAREANQYHKQLTNF